MSLRAQVIKAAEEHGWTVRQTQGHSFLARDGDKGVLGWRTEDVLSYARINGKRILATRQTDQLIEELKKK
ncbi:hypothetical protein OG474_30650 [Kribbella sp. NBC_01505]|uniref:hypothetical protein n=1 Tax=Kribbella sp. NBC_01505 TaxID=2903580 RepID=UPI003868C1B8